MKINSLKDWTKQTLKDLGSLTMGQSPPGSSYNDSFLGLPLLNGAEDLTEKGIRINQYTSKPTRIVKKGCLIFCIRATIGNITCTDQDYCIGRGVASLQVDESKYFRNYIYYIIDSKFEEIRRLSAGSIIKGIKKDELLSLEFDIPEYIDEQKRIAEILQCIDYVINETLNLIYKYKNIKQGLMQDFFGSDTNKSYQIQINKSYFDIKPITWKIEELSNIARINMGQSPLSEDCNFIEGMPFLQGNAEFTDMFPNTTVFCIKPKKIAKPNEILLSVRAPVGEINIADQSYCIGRGLCSINGSSQCDNKFLYYALLYYRFQLNKVKQGTTFKAVNYQDICQMKIKLPPLDEQLAIVAILDEINKALTTEKIFMEKMLKIKKGLMYDLLLGKVRVKIDE